MKKYTIIYAEFIGTTYGNTLTFFKHIECLPEHLKDVVKEKVGWGNVYFIFDGHCEETKY